MILVLLGTQNNSFHRLLEELDKLIIENIIKDKVIVQAGYTSYISNNMEIFSLIPKDKLSILQEDADLIITHGGVGSIITSIKKGKKVIAIPRKHEFNEHVNNHQEEIVELFNKKGFIIGINDVKELPMALQRIPNFTPKKYQYNNSKMLKIIEDFIDKI